MPCPVQDVVKDSDIFLQVFAGLATEEKMFSVVVFQHESLILLVVVYEVADDAERVFDTGVVRVINQLCACTH